MLVQGSLRGAGQDVAAGGRGEQRGALCSNHRRGGPLQNAVTINVDHIIKATASGMPQGRHIGRVAERFRANDHPGSGLIRRGGHAEPTRSRHHRHSQVALFQMLHGDLLHRNPGAGTVRGGAATGEGPHAGGVNILRPGLNGLGRGCAPILRIRLRQAQQRRRCGETFAVALQITSMAIADQ